jgi:hypothetical protein
MKLEQLAIKPKLKKITINDPDIVARYGDEIEYWMYDRHDMDLYLRMSQVNGKDISAIAAVVREVVLNEGGNPVLGDDEVLPPDMMFKVIESAIKEMGNSQSQTSVN